MRRRTIRVLSKVDDWLPSGQFQSISDHSAAILVEFLSDGSGLPLHTLSYGSVD